MKFLSKEILTPVLLMKYLWSQHSRDVRICVSTVFITTDRNCEICQRTKITRAPCRRRNGGVVFRAQKFGDLMTAVHKVLSDNCESRSNHRFAIMGQDLATQWIQSFRAKPKLHNKPREACKSSWSPIGILKSFILTIPWNLAHIVKISPGIIARQHHTDQKQMRLLKEQYAE